MKKVFLFLIVFFSILSCEKQEEYQISIEPLSENLLKFKCGVCNWLVLKGSDGILLSDSGPKVFSAALKSELKKLGSGDVNFIINTHWHDDHTGANLMYGKEATIIAQEHVRGFQMKKQYISLFDEHFDAYPEYACADLTFSRNLTIHFNNEEIELTHMPFGHSAGDAIVYFKKSNVLQIGDLIVKGQFTAIDFEHGGDVQKLAENLKQIIDTMPEDVRIITGHLEDVNLEDLKLYHHMILTTIQTVNEAMDKGLSLEKMKENRILSEWEEYGKHVTCDMWIEAIYLSLTKEKAI